MINTDKTSVSIEDELSKYGTYAARTYGVSMRPLFRTHRDAVVLKSVDRELKKYDVVLYKDGAERYILHRIIGIRKNDYVIRGDNTFVKEYVEKSRILAYLVSFNRKGKHCTVDDFWYKLYSRFWNFLFPLRKASHKLRNLFIRAKRKIFGKRSSQ